jgi:hypothetical protein
MKKTPKGKILRIKQGYNPNSSSMGSIVYALPAALLATTAGFGIVSGIIMSAFVKNKNENRLKEKNKTSQEVNPEDSAEGQ